ELKPSIQDYSHQDSMFGNAFSSRAYFIVHPEWLSENVNPPVSKPLTRKPWAWEQPRYRQNIQRYENGQMTPIIKSTNGNVFNGSRASSHGFMAPPYSYTHPVPNGTSLPVVAD
ncbi:hypothetical protein FSP39_006458, partial [Pinctada imbricata]